MINYDVFYRQYGIRKKDNLLNPKLFDYSQFFFPKGSFLHYLGDGPLDEGPDPRDVIFTTVPGSTYILPVSEAGDVKGNPRHLPVPPETKAKEFLSANRFFKRIIKLETTVRDERSLIVCNYGQMPLFYNYPRSIYSYYNEWWNKHMALVKMISELSKTSTRQHFIFVKLPDVIPKPGDLVSAAKDMSQTALKKFKDSESFMFLEIWKWIGANRHESMFSTLSVSDLQKVNLVFVESGKWTTVNMGLLDSWRKATDEELKAKTNMNKAGITAVTFGKVFINLAIHLVSMRAGDIDSSNTLTEVKTSVNTTKKTVDGDINATVDSPVILDTPGTTDQTDTGNDFNEDSFNEEELDKNINQLDIIHDEIDERQEFDNVEDAFKDDVEYSFENGIKAKCDVLAESGGISAAQFRAYNELANKYKTIPSPDGKGTLADFAKIKQEEVVLEPNIALDDIPNVLDKSMLNSSLNAFDAKYNTTILKKDVANMVLAIQNAGIAVTDYEVEKEVDIGGEFDSYTVRVSPVEGSNSTIRFKLPVLADDGTFTANGTKYRMRKQRGEIPIRKIDTDTVALSSYYGKVFISRSERRVNNYGTWITNQLMSIGLDNDDQRITSIYPGNVFDNTTITPRMYSLIAQRFKSMDISKSVDGKTKELFSLSFDYGKRETTFGKEVVSKLEKDGLLLFGVNSNGSTYLLMDKNDVIYKHDGKNVLTESGYLEEYLDLEIEKAPVDIAEIRLMGKTIPIGVVLGYQIGLNKLIKLLGVTPRIVEAGKRINLQSHEYSIVFSDETLIFSKYDKEASLILAGFNNFHNSIRGFDSYLFDKPGVYLNVLESNNLTARYLREIELMDKMFIDPIARELLVEMKEPTTFKGLLLRSCNMLTNDAHPDAFDAEFIRTKGNERMAGAVYTELVKSIRAHGGRVGKAKLPLDFNPHCVWRSIAEDPSISLVSDINPIENLKQIEAVTYSGNGGRNSRSMTKHTRSYHKNDMGVISEATVDSGDVGINTYTSANPQFTGLRGLSRRYSKNTMGPTALFSTSALLAPSADRDDPKRVNFINIQNTHGIACDGYRQAMVRTGYEQVIPHRVGDLFAFSAKQDGKVISLTDTGMIVEYADGTKQGVELGRRFGQAAGLTLPHDVVSNVEEGAKFKKQDILAFNNGFFEADVLNPKQVIFKTSMTVKTVLMESTTTLEDSSGISDRLSKKLSTKATKIKTVIVNFDQVISKLVKVNQLVNAEDVLCVIEEEMTANNALFDSESLDTLKILGSQNTPMAKVKGTIDKIEVFYHGDKEDMSDSVLTLVNSSDKLLSSRLRSINKPVLTGSVGMGYRIEGEPLALDTIAIRFYITSDVSASIGDKGVFGNQLKTVFGRKFNDNIITESGTQIDAIFGYKSVSDRIVMSPEIIGTRTTLLKVIAKKAAKIYRS